jgi:hypothetical protein
MTEQRNRTSVAPPPEFLLRDGLPAPEARTIAAEVRSDASIKFNPKAAPAFLLAPNQAFGALLVWRFELAWSVANQIQQWLTGPSPISPGNTCEEELQGLFNNLRVAPAAGGVPQSFLTYVGTFLAADLSYASYTMAVGMRFPVSRQLYQQALMNELNALKANPATLPWYTSLMGYLRLCLDPPSTREEFALLASNVGVLTAPAGGAAADFPMVDKLLNP